MPDTITADPPPKDYKSIQTCHLPRPTCATSQDPTHQKIVPKRTKANLTPKKPKPNHETREAKKIITQKTIIHRKGNQIEVTFKNNQLTEPEEYPTTNTPKLIYTTNIDWNY